MAYVDKVKSGKNTFYYLCKTIKTGPDKWKKVRIKLGTDPPTEQEIKTKSKELELIDQWEELIRTDWRQFSISLPLHSIQYSNEWVGGPKWRKIVIYMKGHVGYFYENLADHTIMGEHCMQFFLKSEKRFKRYLEFWVSEFNKYRNIVRKIRETDLTSKTNDELAVMLREVYRSAVYWHGIGINVDAIDTVLHPMIENELKSLMPEAKKSEISDVYNKLTYPDEPTYMTRMMIDKLKIFLIKNKTEYNKKARKFVEDYYWVNFSWGDSPEITLESLEDDAKATDNPQKELKTMLQRIDLMKNEKHRLLTRFEKSSSILRKYIKIFDEYSILHDLRKEGQMVGVQAFRNIYKQIAQNIDYDVELLYGYFPLELVEIIEDGKQPDTKTLHVRKAEWGCAFHNDGTTEEWTGKKAAIRRSEVLGLDEDDKRYELSGMAASQGRIIGQARICLSASEALSKIQQGDILVTGMTGPEFVPAMTKAGAIVTDEGGCTCHAAIIARELGKPCVVGTRSSTRMIKDGDTLEVNANHGVVKILNKN